MSKRKPRLTKAERKLSASNALTPGQSAPPPKGYVPAAGPEVLDVEIAGFSPPADLVIAQLPEEQRAFIYAIRAQKAAGTRPMPSASMLSVGDTPPLARRAALLDKVAALVDQALSGRSNMCLQCAALLQRALAALGFAATAKEGQATFKRLDGSSFAWRHAWVEISDGSTIDGNADSIRENPFVGSGCHAEAFWGPRAELPRDRSFPLGSALLPQDFNDIDVVRTWWPALQSWMRSRGWI
ncbi:MAG: hypothetical protein ABI548_06430 [Polyangiaceae bacterium]